MLPLRFRFCEEDIDQILERRTQVIQLQSEGKGSTFSKASFAADGSNDINIDDPDFWNKWAQKANLNLDQLAKKVSHTDVEERSCNNNSTRTHW